MTVIKHLLLAMKNGYALTVLYLDSLTHFFLIFHRREMYQSSLRYQYHRMMLVIEKSLRTLYVFFSSMSEV